MTDLPPNVYRLPQSRFDAIPGSPWVYWASKRVLDIFVSSERLGDSVKICIGMRTGDNFRFIRYWWEVGKFNIGFGCTNRQNALQSGKQWFPYMKGGGRLKWYGNQEYVVNWLSDGYEIKENTRKNYPQLGDDLGWKISNEPYYFREGITWSNISSAGFSARISPGGFIFDVAGSSAFPYSNNMTIMLLGLLNSTLAGYILGLLNPTINFQVGDVANIPNLMEQTSKTDNLRKLIRSLIYVCRKLSQNFETSFDFIVPSSMVSNRIETAKELLSLYEEKLDSEVYRLNGFCDEDRDQILAELAGQQLQIEDGEISTIVEDETETIPTNIDLYIHWISYATGIILGRYYPGITGRLGCAIYRTDNFATGSLPAPDIDEFDELVGSSEDFAYIDETGGRHVFSRAVEEKLRALADSDGIAVLDQGHPDDLPAKVETALELMLGETGAAEVIAAATGESHDLSKALRRFLERDFFTKHHIKMYRKRPVYWLLQSPQRLYGLYLFHERLTRDTLFVIQRQYVDRKINLTRQQLAEQRLRVEKAVTARERRELNKQAEDLERLLLDVEEFARRLKAITDRGYTPHIDDGVILNMSPLWEVIPAWSKEPKKYWEGLERGDYDWAHLAMDYWPERVREKCHSDKSLAIAHGHEE